ncbi:uroporphyrinogen-III synthase [Sedimentitalea sp. CY04]|uniref:Uroporphyrinogen-III synthase n=1 Tax=Parasedimentitalea denitrificans TaxID=2211118 RepID=A0ABX0W554_9RHOB|nr:uroporphyrinogen-III synthase [Sedimentitalea sp. CY04]NIZ60674.1 uroporphyrinogen-III synthase [Sedimentitalea sp. CY04]
MACLLMTRPPDAARRFVELLPKSLTTELEVIYSPLISVQPMDARVSLDSFDAVIFTSSNGVSATDGIIELKDRVAFCLGQRTTQIASNAGWTAQMCGKTADDLVEYLLQRRPSEMLVHLRGQHSRGNIAERLTEAGLTCREQIVYDQCLLPLTTEADSALARLQNVIVPLFSPRTARQFADLCPAGSKIHLIAMSEAVEEPLKSLKYKDLQVCSEPEAKSMAQLVSEVATQLIRVESDLSAQ